MSRPPLRQLQAEQTRRLILDAALARFTRDGYGATSIADVAGEAGVAVPTVYASVGPKPTLLRLLLDGIDEKAGIEEQAAALLASSDPEDVLTRQVRITRSLAERCGGELLALASAAGVDPEIAVIYRAGMDRHRAGALATVRRLADLGALAEDVEVPRATAILATLTEPALWRTLTGAHGWSFDEAERWIRGTLASQLLRPSGSNPKAGGADGDG